MSAHYEKARAIAEAAANGWDKFGDTAGIVWLTDAIMEFGAMPRDDGRCLREALARAEAERDEAAKRDAEEFELRSEAPGDVWGLVRHLEEQCRIFIRERDEWKTVADRDRASLRAAEAEINRLKEGTEALGAVLKPFAKLSFSFDGFSFDPAEMVVLGRCCGTFQPNEHAHLQRAIDAAQTALATLSPKEQP